MGAYNTLNVNVKCRNCSRLYKSNLQFKFGDIWQHEYKLDDAVILEDKSLNNSNYVVYGILEDSVCLYCGYFNPDEYDIFVIRGQIKRYSINEDINLYLGKNEGNYYEIR